MSELPTSLSVAHCQKPNSARTRLSTFSQPAPVGDHSSEDLTPPACADRSLSLSPLPENRATTLGGAHPELPPPNSPRQHGAPSSPPQQLRNGHLSNLKQHPPPPACHPCSLPREFSAPAGFTVLLTNSNYVGLCFLHHSSWLAPIPSCPSH